MTEYFKKLFYNICPTYCLRIVFLNLIGRGTYLHQYECTIFIKLCVNYFNNQYIHCMRCHKVRGRGRYIRDIVSRRGHFSKIK